MTSSNDKLSSLTSVQLSGWHRKAVERRKNREWLKRAAAMRVKVLQALRRQGMTKGELAERIGVEDQQVDRIVKGEETLTPETLAKLELLLNIKLVGSE